MVCRGGTSSHPRNHARGRVAARTNCDRRRPVRASATRSVSFTIVAAGGSETREDATCWRGAPLAFQPRTARSRPAAPRGSETPRRCSEKDRSRGGSIDRSRRLTSGDTTRNSSRERGASRAAVAVSRPTTRPLTSNVIAPGRWCQRASVPASGSIVGSRASSSRMRSPGSERFVCGSRVLKRVRR